MKHISRCIKPNKLFLQRFGLLPFVNFLLFSLTNASNISQVLAELKEYATEVDVDFVRKSVRAIGRCAIKVRAFFAAHICIYQYSLSFSYFFPSFICFLLPSSSFLSTATFFADIIVSSGGGGFITDFPPHTFNSFGVRQIRRPCSSSSIIFGSIFVLTRISFLG